MRVIVSPRAQKHLKKFPKTAQIAIARSLKELKRPGKIKAVKLRGYKDFFRIRVGNYRVVYRKRVKVVYIVLIAHRKEAYLLTKKLLG